VISLIYRKARHDYTFTEEGQGYRFWYKTVLKDLVTEGILDERDVGDILPDLEYHYSAHSERASWIALRKAHFN
jgi:hypothetical protein